MHFVWLTGAARRLIVHFAFLFILIGLLDISRAQIVVSEIHYDPVGGSSNEFVEVYNAGTGSVTLSNWRFNAGITYLFASPTVLPPGGYLVVVADRTTFFARYPTVTNVATGSFSGQLNNGGELLTLSDAATSPVFSVTYNNVAPWPTAAAGLGSSLVLLNPFGDPNDPSNWGASAEVHGNPGGPGALYVRDIVINEVLAHTDPPQEDAVELKNVTTNAVNISGWYLSDSATTRQKYRFPTGTVVAAGSYVVVYQQQLTNSAGALIPFEISSKGDEIYLSQANTNGDITRFVDEVLFDASKNGVSFGLYPDGAEGDFIPLAAPTFGVANPVSLENFRTGTGAANVGPYVHTVVINEIMYHPATTNVPMSVEFVELMNTSANTVQLYNVDYPDLTWSLSGGIGFTFPTNLALDPGALMVITATNDLTAFRTAYNVPTNVIVLGPWTGALNNAGDTLRIRVPNTPEPPSNIAARYVADEVKFKDTLPWPLAADGLGGSLERIDPTVWGNTADNWHAAPNVATPGRTNTPFVAPGSIVISEIMAVNRSTLTDEEGDYSDWIELYNTRPYDISLTGWHLTDSSSMPTQWTFPPVTIPAHGYLVVFADMKNRTNDVTRLHTNFSLDEGGEFLGLYRADLVEEFALDPYPPQYADVGYGFSAYGNDRTSTVRQGTSGRYLVPTNATMLATNWNTLAFNDSAWTRGTNGFGYDTAVDYNPYITTDVEALMLNKVSSLFIRFPFVVTNTGGFGDMELRLRFEDGFIAWLNGVPVASNNVPAAASWDANAPTARNEAEAVQFTPFDLTPFLYLLGTGTNLLSIQCLNAGSNSSDLLLLTELNLSGTGGSTTGLGQVSGYLYPATPSGLNPTSLPAVVATPELSSQGGVFAGAVTVTVTCADAGATIRYTLDGSEPTPTSAVYTAALVFTTETELRVRAFENGKVPSPRAGAVFRLSFLGINEFLASNAMSAPEIADFSAFPDYIELYNAGTTTVSLAGYHLSDSVEQPFKWKIPAGATIPAGGYFLVWADGENAYPGISKTRPFWPYASYVTRYYHGGFKLSALGEAVCLFSPGGSLIDAVTYGPQSVDVSRGRLPDGSTNWVYFGQPTAGTNNLGPGLSHNLYKAPAVSIGPVDGRLFMTGTVTVTLSSGTNVTEIRYTTNGGMPNASSLLYTGAFTVASSGVIRARAYAPDLLPGPIATRSFIFDTRLPDVPVLALTMDPKLMYDPVTGIYSNNLKEREVPGYMQFYTTPSNAGFQVNGGFRLYSYNTFLKAQKPFTVYMNADYGDEALSYKLFPDRPVGLYDRFILRNGNDDWEEAYLRDTLGQKLVRGVADVATQDFVPCAAYLNGNYYGVLNIQEKMDEMYCVKNFGVQLADIDFFENDGLNANAWLVDNGTEDAWLYLQSVLTNSMANPTNYALAKSLIDIEDLVDYVAAQAYLYDSSWQHNRKWWKERNVNGRWRWCITDLDRALMLINVNNNTINSLASNMHAFPQLLANPEFRAYAAQRIMAHLSGSFSTNRTLPMIDAEANRIRNEIQAHINLYAARAGIPSYTFWTNEIETIRSFARQRPAIAMQQVANYFSTGRLARVTVGSTGGTGRVLANFVALNTNGGATLASGLPVQFTAVPDIGQVFVRWEAITSTPVTLISTNSIWRYLDTVTNDIAGWYSNNFDDTTWSNGPGQLGYGDGDEATQINYGPDLSNKYITTYFRSSLYIPNLSVLTNIQMGLLRDDGAVVYINNKEVLRSNLPTGTVTYTTLALSNITGAAENTYTYYNLSSTNFVAGTNLIAVEIHNNSITNADLGFDLTLLASSMGVVSILTNTEPTLVWTPRDGELIRAVFGPAGVNLLPPVLATHTSIGATGSPYYATGDIFVPSNTTFTVGPGVEIRMPEYSDIRVQGQLLMQGSTNAPIYLRPNTDLNAAVRYYIDPVLADTNDAKRRWGGISFERATHTGELHHVVIRDATLNRTDPVNYKSAISALSSDLFMDGLDVADVQNPIFVRGGKSTVLQNSRVRIDITGDGINLKKTQYARIENCEFIGPATMPDTDGIDYDGIAGGIIRGCYIHDFLGFNNDAIDIGELAIGIIIESNLIERISDKSASVGQASTAIYRRNIARDCTLGLGIKDLGSHALVENSTFHKCVNPLALYEKNRGDGGGMATVRNCIFSESLLEPVSVDSHSTATVSYCLSDTLPVIGTGNLVAQPQFLNAGNNNFRLQAGSAAVDAGDPTYSPDADGSRIDIGALPFDWREGHVMISEIHYHPADTNAAEFVELYNPGGTNLDLSGYRFTKGFEATFAPGTILSNGSYIIVASSTNGLTGVSPLVIWATGTLDNAGEIIELQDTVSNEIDRVEYESFSPWPSLPDGLGPSLSVINPRRDNSVPGNWYASGAVNGTPGRPFDNQFPGGQLAYGRGTSTTFNVSFEAVDNLLYTLEFTPGLLPPSWQSIQSGTRGVDGRISLGHTPGSTNSAGVYRVRVDTP